MSSSGQGHRLKKRLMISYFCLKSSCRITQCPCPFLCPPPPVQILGGEGGVLEILFLSICSSVCVLDHVRSISPEPLNHFLKNLVWWCIIMKQCVMRKNWFTIFNVKVTARAYITIFTISSKLLVRLQPNLL